MATAIPSDRYRWTAAAQFVVKVTSFILGGLCAYPVTVFALAPLRLLRLEFTLAPWSMLKGLVLYIAFAAVLYWVRGAVAALLVAGSEGKAQPLYRSTRAWAGAAIPLALAVLVPLFMHSAGGRRAIAEAERQVGPGYSFCVQRLRIAGKRGSAVVVAYSDTEIRPVAVEWHDD